MARVPLGGPSRFTRVIKTLITFLLCLTLDEITIKHARTTIQQGLPCQHRATLHKHEHSTEEDNESTAKTIYGQEDPNGTIYQPDCGQRVWTQSQCARKQTLTKLAPLTRHNTQTYQRKESPRNWTSVQSRRPNTSTNIYVHRKTISSTRKNITGPTSTPIYNLARENHGRSP